MVNPGILVVSVSFIVPMKCLDHLVRTRADAVHIWARNSGKRMPVRIPAGCLLVQAGKQLEWMSGGLVKGVSLHCSDLMVAGFHEVVCTQATLDVRLELLD